MNNRDDFTLEPFTPLSWAANPHAQTVVGIFARRKQGVTFRRERLDTPDGDFVDVDFADVNGRTWDDLGPDAPIVLLLHGLAGSARRGYSYQSYHHLAQRGIRGVGLNFRGCSGEMNRTHRIYHAGSTGDVALVVDWLRQRYPNPPIGMAGVSLGANMLLKYLGETGTTAVQAAVAISPPFNLNAGSKVLSTGIGKVYSRVLLRRLKKVVREKGDAIRPYIDYETALNATTFPVFDGATIASIYDYRDAADYYTQNSSGDFLHGIQIPTLLLRAMDDPFFDPKAVPWQTINNHPCLVNAIVPHGGHVGFIENGPLTQLPCWAERQMARFMAHVLFR